MSKAKLSFEEKSKRLLNFFHEKKNVFLLKELEKIVPKEKGIPFQSIKEVLESLVCDELVQSDKIGTSTFFWSFPSDSYQKKLQESKNLEISLESLQSKIDSLNKEIEELSNNSEINENDAPMREKINAEIVSLKGQQQQLTEEIEQLDQYNLENLNAIKRKCLNSREAIDRWTDNVFAIKSWCKKKTQMEESEVNKILQIPQDFDYYED
ncbi:Meiotic nuclear division protein 1 -like protein [Sarcoptes scabiei]|uniref:Meiotic nuclear division protein 1 homolog n=1 Tax=Sarcoptes scabiei TaxID=52283 RepID=A0A834R3A9_SARSC|nr:Meiotic nuclear division protein 1 -like protein [Sarcoptes scabiei]